MIKKITLSALNIFLIFCLSALTADVSAQTCFPRFTGGGNQACDGPTIAPFYHTQIRHIVGATVDYTVYDTTKTSYPGGDCSTEHGIYYNYPAAPYTTPDTVQAGLPSTLYVTDTGYLGIGIYADFNGDGDFNDSMEFLDSTYAPLQGNTYTMNFTVPPSIPRGKYLMRVLGVWSHYPGPGEACNYFDTGASAKKWGTYIDLYLYVQNQHCTPIIMTNPISDTVCLGNTANFSVTSIGSPYTGSNRYRWILNDTTAISGHNSSTLTLPNVGPSDSGYYKVIVSNSACTDTVNGIPIDGDTSFSAPLRIYPRPNITISGPSIFCPGGSTLLISDTALAYAWALNGIPIAGATKDTMVATRPGNYTVNINNRHCISPSLPFTIYNYPQPNPIISPAPLTKLCTGGTQVLTSSTSAGWTYQWFMNGTAIPTATNTSFTALATGTYTLTATNSNSCRGTSNNARVEINNPPTDSVYVSGSKIICQGGAIQIHALSSDTGESYQWQFNGTTIAGATGPSYWASAPGSYNVIGYNGCYVASASVSLTSSPYPFIISSGPDTFCVGGSVVLNSSVTGTNVTYKWLKNNVIIPGATSTNYTVTDSGSYSLIVISDSSCTANATAVTVVVNQLPTPSAVLNPGNVLHVTQVYDSYQWLKNNVVIPGATKSSYVVTSTGDYSVNVIDKNGCSGVSNPPIHVTFLGINKVNMTASDVNIYPNPATSVVNIEAPGKVNVAITSIDGKEVLNNSNTNKVDISGLANGVYTIRVSNTNGELIKIEKLVKTAQ